MACCASSSGSTTDPLTILHCPAVIVGKVRIAGPSQTCSYQYFCSYHNPYHQLRIVITVPKDASRGGRPWLFAHDESSYSCSHRWTRIERKQSLLFFGFQAIQANGLPSRMLKGWRQGLSSFTRGWSDGYLSHQLPRDDFRLLQQPVAKTASNKGLKAVQTRPIQPLTP